MSFSAMGFSSCRTGFAKKIVKMMISIIGNVSLMMSFSMFVLVSWPKKTHVHICNFGELDVEKVTKIIWAGGSPLNLGNAQKFNDSLT